MSQQTDEKYMQRCIDLAWRGLGNTAPNPLVGALISCENKIIGEGYHMKYGGPHAEVNAIQSVANQEILTQSTLYVNLEPCSHTGKTPPCTNLIIEKKNPQSNNRDFRSILFGCRKRNQTFRR